jgi:hypothetical protein
MKKLFLLAVFAAASAIAVGKTATCSGSKTTQLSGGYSYTTTYNWVTLNDDCCSPTAGAATAQNTFTFPDGYKSTADSFYVDSSTAASQSTECSNSQSYS